MTKTVTVPVVSYASVTFDIPSDWDIEQYADEIDEMAEDLISAWYYAPPSVEWEVKKDEPVEINEDGGE